MSFERRCVNVILGVQSIVEELKFMHDKLEEAQAVIRQLSGERKPGEPILIHPHDLGQLIEKTPSGDFVFTEGETPDATPEITVVGDVRYKQSVLMPIKSGVIQ